MIVVFFCFKQKTAYEMRISDWSSDVCSSDLPLGDVEREPSGIVAAASRIGRGSEQLAHMVEQARVGGQVRPRRAPDRFLVHLHQTLYGVHVARQMAAGRDRTSVV